MPTPTTQKLQILISLTVLKVLYNLYLKAPGRLESKETQKKNDFYFCFTFPDLRLI